MAMIKYGPGIENISGKVGGTIYRSDQCGAHEQGWPRLIKRRTWSQDQIRRGFADLHYTFHVRLTRKQRSAWFLYALRHPIKNKKGQTVTIRGWPMFFRYNIANWLLGIPPAHDPPS